MTEATAIVRVALLPLGIMGVVCGVVALVTKGPMRNHLILAGIINLGVGILCLMTWRWP